MKRRRRLTLVAILGLAIAVSLFILPAAGDGPVIADLGTLHLDMGPEGDRFVFDPVTGDDLEQTLSQSNCRLSSDELLVDITGAGTQLNKRPFAGLKDHRIGVGQNGEGKGEPCARINKDLGQSLNLSLTGSLAGDSIGYAEIDLGFKFDGDALLELRQGGPTGNLIQTVTVLCNSVSDCGPDSGGADNERVVLWLDPDDEPDPGHWQSFQLTGVFDTITIKPGSAAASGAVSLEAGFNGSPPGPLGDSLGTNDTLFGVVQAFDGDIACGDTETLSDGGNAVFQTTRGFDIDGECKGPEDGLLFNFESGTEGDELFVDFVTEPVDTHPDTVAQFLEVITWSFDAPPDVPGGDDQQKTLSYDDHLGEGKRLMPWCLQDPRDENGDLPVGTSTDPVDPSMYLPTGHTSCLIESNSHVTGIAEILQYPLGTFIKVDVVYNTGDGKRWSN